MRKYLILNDINLPKIAIKKVKKIEPLIIYTDLTHNNLLL